MNAQKIISAARVIFVVLGAVFIASDSHAASIGEDPIAFYGDRVVFDVFREGDLIGTHEVTFRRDGKDIAAESTFDISIKILVVPVFSYLYTSRERWRDGTLVSLSAETNDNGDASNVSVNRSGGFLRLSGSGGNLTTDTGTFPTTHWNSAVIGSTKVINTITGKLNSVTIENLGTETVPTATGDRQATHFAYRGDLETEVWYDTKGRWVKMRFPGKDGVMIEYRCRICGIDHRKTGQLSTDRRPVASSQEATQ